MSSTATLERPARQAPPDSLRDALPVFSPLPCAPITAPAAEAALAQAGSSAPALADLLFDNISIPPVSPTGGTEAPAAEPFKIDSMDKAAWAASKVLDAQARIADRAALATAYKTRIDDWLASSNKEDEASAAYLLMLLKPYVETSIAQQHRSRSLLLVSATISLRKLPDRLDITDSTAALAYCEAEHPEAVIVKKELSRSVLKKLALDGTAIPGVVMELGSSELYIKSASERSLSCAC